MIASLGIIHICILRAEGYISIYALLSNLPFNVQLILIGKIQ